MMNIRMILVSLVVAVSTGCAVQPSNPYGHRYGGYHSVDPWAMQPARIIGPCPHGSPPILSRAVPPQVVGCGPIPVMDSSSVYPASNTGYAIPVQSYGQQHYAAQGYPPSNYVPGGTTPQQAQAQINAINAKGNCGKSSAGNALADGAVGAVIGGVIGALTSRDSERGRRTAQGAGIGAIGGAAIGHSRTQSACDTDTAEVNRLQAIIDDAAARCRDTLSQRQVNGVLSETATRDCAAWQGQNFDRIGGRQPQNAPRPASMPPYSPSFQSTQPVTEK